MVHAPWRHGDNGNYNGPKVDPPESCPETAPLVSNGKECSWLYAGNPVYPAVLAQLSQRLCTL
jgi:hypothetical protein